MCATHTIYSNLQKAYKQVRSNGGSRGVDKMNVKDFGDWFENITKNFNWECNRIPTNHKPLEGYKSTNPKADSANCNSRNKRPSGAPSHQSGIATDIRPYISPKQLRISSQR